MGLAFGFLFIYIVSRISLENLIRLAPLLLVFSVVLLGLTLFTSLGVEKNGARRSMLIGRLFLMPAEVTKPAILLFLVHWLRRLPEQSTGARLRWLAALALPIVMIVAMKDLGTPAVIVTTLVVVAFVWGMPWLWLIGGVAAFGGAITLLISVASHRLRYLRAWLDPYCLERTKLADPSAHQTCLGETQALQQSYQAVADGGLFGVPLGGGQGPLHVLEGHNDFIGSLVIEHFGLAGLLVLSALLLTFLWRGTVNAMLIERSSHALVAFGAAAFVTIQGAAHLAVVTGTVPPKGLTLPLVSAGSSSIFATCLLVGLLIGAARDSAIEGSRT